MFETPSSDQATAFSPAFSPAEVAAGPRHGALDRFLESPLHAFDLRARMRVPTPADGVLVAEFGHLGYLILRGHTDDADFMNAVSGVLGQPLPTAPLGVRAFDRTVMLWLSPDEWLVVCRRGARDGLVRQLALALDGVHAQCVDSSGGYGMLRLAGPAHARLLRHLSPYDFDRLTPGRCVGTVMSKTNVLVVRGDAAGVALVFRRSFSDYVWRLVERAAQPYGLCVAAPRMVADPLFTALLAPVA